MPSRQSLRLAALLTVFAISAATAATDLAELRLAFEPNLGQADPSVRFLARASGETVFLSDGGVVVSLRSGGGESAVKISFPDGAMDQLSGLAPLPGESHYLKGNDPTSWLRRIPHFGRVRAEDVWDGVAIEFHGNGHRLEYDFVVDPGAGTDRIRLRFESTAPPELDEHGDLILAAGGGQLRQQKPIAYQEIGGRRRMVTASYRIEDNGEVAVLLGDYDRSLPLVIDPVVSFATFFGGTGFDEATAVAVDAAGNVYVAGTAQSTDLPTTLGAVQTDHQSGSAPGDAFVAKLDPTGSTVLYATYLGGTNTDEAVGISLDLSGNIYLAGRTVSSDFPTTFVAFQRYHSQSDPLPDGFVAKLNASGSVLVYSTFIGGNGSDLLYALDVDATGSAYVVGATDSSNFPTTQGAFRSGACPSLGLGGFVTKLNTNGSGLVYSTLLCGSSTDEVFGIAVDSQGRANVTGRTQSEDFPIAGPAPQAVADPFSQDAFAAKLSANGSALLFSTYLGGTGDDGGSAIALDPDGNIYVAGYTRSKDFPVTTGAFQESHADNGLFEDAFVAVLNPAGSAFVYGTFLGGSAADRASAIAVDSDGRAYIAGHTDSADFPASAGPCQTGFGGGSDAFLTAFQQTGNGLVYSVYLGGNADDRASDVALDADGNALVVGRTSSRNFPTTENAFRSAYANGYQGATDAFVAHVEDSPAPAAPCIGLNGIVNGASFLPGPVSPGEIVSIFGDGLGPAEAQTYTVSNGQIDAFLAGTQVFFDGDAAPIIATSSGQVNAIVPYSVAGKQTLVVEADYLGARTEGIVVAVADSSPAIFALDQSGGGQGAVLNQDNSVNGPGNPAAKGSVIQIFATGEGQTSPAGIDGLLAGDIVSELPQPNLEVAVTIGGLPAVIHYAGAAPTLVAGVIQVNAFVPSSVTSGDAIPVLVFFGANASPAGVTVAIE